MPVLGSSAYNTCEDVLNRIRVILNDSEVAGGDVLTDAAPFTFSILNSAYERVQLELAKVGVETMTTEVWMIALPIMPTADPEARMVIDDSGCNIFYPSTIGTVFSNVPQLPPDLLLPLTLWERPTGSSITAQRLNQPNGRLSRAPQQSYLLDWEWEADGLRFRGATQSQDLKVKYEKNLPLLVATTDPVPIRGVTNAAAYFGATLFAQSRGGMVAAEFKVEAMEEVILLQKVSARRRQRKQIRRRPYSGHDGRRTSAF